MARPPKLDLEQRLVALNSVASEAAAMRPFLADASRHVVSKAAARVRDDIIAGLELDLTEALGRVRRGDLDDPNCMTMLVLLEALDRTESADPEQFRIAARFSRVVEIAGGPPIDHGAAVRVRGASGLVRLRDDGAMPVLIGHLADEFLTVREGAARCLALHGDPAGANLVQLLLHQGERDPDVVTECLTTWLTLDPHENAIDEVRRRLRAGDSAERRTAVLALGESGRQEACSLLREFWQSLAGPGGEEVGIVEIALNLLRTEEARLLLQDIAKARGA